MVADFSTDHRMILSKISLSVRPKSRMNASREIYIETLKTKLQNLSGSDMDDLDHKWSQIFDVLRSAGLNVLGTLRKRHRNWFNESDHEVR